MRAPKKSETLEIRLPHAAKTAFMARCHAGGQTASEVVRDFIEGELNARGRSRSWRIAAAALAGLAVGAVAAPSLAQTGRSDRAAFERLDRDHDGVVSFAEFRR